MLMFLERARKEIAHQSSTPRSLSMKTFISHKIPNGGQRGIRTPETLPPTRFPERAPSTTRPSVLTKPYNVDTKH